MKLYNFWNERVSWRSKKKQLWNRYDGGKKAIWLLRQYYLYACCSIAPWDEQEITLLKFDCSKMYSFVFSNTECGRIIVIIITIIVSCSCNVRRQEYDVIYFTCTPPFFVVGTTRPIDEIFDPSLLWILYYLFVEPITTGDSSSS